MLLIFLEEKKIDCFSILKMIFLQSLVALLIILAGDVFYQGT